MLNTSRNICLFNRFNSTSDTLNTVYFVLETEPQIADKFKFDTIYKMYCVKNGSGALYTTYGKTPLYKDDVFFTFPSFEYSIESIQDFEYYFIGFVGMRAAQLLERYRITTANNYFPKCHDVLKVWSNYFSLAHSGNTDIVSESTILYTLAKLDEHTKHSAETTFYPESFLKVKKFIDDNLQNPALSLDIIGAELGYNKTYISALFMKYMDTPYTSYVNETRMQNALSLIKNNITSIKDISYLCGYNDPLYFSKTFKKYTGKTPKEYIASLK